MKKSVIIITTLVYFIAISIVAVLGYVAEIHNPPIFAESIVMVLNDAPNFPEEPYQYYSNGAPIYTITYNSEADIEATDNNKYTYLIKFNGIDEFEYYYESINAVDLHLMPYSSKGECENTSLSYHIDNDRADYVEVTKEGVVSFKVFSKIGSEEVAVSTKDGTDITIYVKLYW